MKNALRLISLLLVGVCLFLTVSCKGKKQPTFLQLSETPYVTVTPTSEVVKRYNDEFTDTFVPSDDYGTLVPFVGEFYQYKSDEQSSDMTISLPAYGLCTVDGAIVVDPVYDGVITHTLKGGVLYELLIGSDDASLAQKRLLIPSDGRWVTELSANNSVSKLSSEDFYILERTRTVRRNKKKEKLVYYDFYSYESKFLFTFDKKLTFAENTSFTIGEFDDSFAPVNVAVTTETTEKGPDGKNVVKKEVETKGYFINKKGKQVFKNEEFLKVEAFYNGLAVVCNKEGLYGVIKSNGKYLIKPQYNIINRNTTEGYFACGLDSYFLILDANGITVSKIPCENADIEVIGTEKLIYKKTLKYTGKTEFFSCVTGGAFVCTETGQFPDPDSGKNGLFSCTYSGVTDIFKSDGNSVAQFNDFGRIAGVWGDIAVIVSKNGSKTAVLNIKSGEKSDWIDASFSGQVFNGKYVVLKSEQNYMLYNGLLNEFETQTADFITTFETFDNSYLSVTDGGFVTLFMSDMSILMRYRYKTEVASR